VALQVLTSEQRKLLSNAVTAARSRPGLGAEDGALKALQALAVDQHEPFPKMTREQRELRNRLRAHGRQLGDARDKQKGTQEIRLLGREVAFEQWHRMLFARFLAENQLLIDPRFGVAISMEEAAELAKEAGTDTWSYAARCAQSLLPAIFRSDDPSLAVELPPESKIALEKLLGGLDAAIFTASDALGWTYQFWQSEESEQVKKKGGSIGADDISARTQFFTEHYMVEFLLHNTIGAWHAGKVLAAKPELLRTAASEAELRAAVAIDGCDFGYLRFVREGDDASGAWQIGAGTYPTWPTTAAAITLLDPCLGSGHILVAAFELLVRLRRHEERLSIDAAIQAVIRDNLFGLELDPRCTQIGAFALALHAWKLAGRRIELPAVNIACCGLSVGGSKDDWMKFASVDSRFQNGMAALYDLFQQAPLLGSLIDPARTIGVSMLEASFDELEPMLDAALAKPSDEATREVGVAAAGMVDAIRLLRRRYTLVITNPPYLGRGNQDDEMKAYADEYEPEAKQDLATLFIGRAMRWCDATGSIAMVTPQNWLSRPRYTKLRQRLLIDQTWTVVAWLGPGAFQEITGEVVQAALVAISGTKPAEDACFLGIAVSSKRGERPILAPEKAELLMGSSGDASGRGVATLLNQKLQCARRSAAVQLTGGATDDLLSVVASTWQGIITTDDNRFIGRFWEFSDRGGTWELQQGPPEASLPFTARSNVIRWEQGQGELHVGSNAHNFPSSDMLRPGVAVRRMQPHYVTRFDGVVFHDHVAPVVPNDDRELPAILAFLQSEEFADRVRENDQQPKVAVSSVVGVEFERDRWFEVARALFPVGLPAPQSNDSTQWLFHGHPVGVLAGGPPNPAFSVVDLVGQSRHQSLVTRRANAAHALHVAIARIVGYRWPAELDESMELDEACRDWATRCKGLAHHADNDGIVPINPMRGEPSAADRVTALLRDAFAQANAALTTDTLAQLVAATRSTAASPNDWLLDDFFPQHCKLFHDRPFVWHIWDGRRDGFNVLVHYHRLAAPNGEGRKLLEKLTHAYLGDWILRQQQAVEEKQDSADGRLAAALTLQQELLSILKGEPPYDLFVRWKPLHEQPIGWDPDINDGVRLNIRPFLRAKDFGKKDAGLLRTKPEKVKRSKDGGNEPQANRPREDFPWFWGCNPEADPSHATDFAGGREYRGNRWNDLHFSNAVKLAARQRHAHANAARGDA